MVTVRVPLQLLILCFCCLLAVCAANQIYCIDTNGNYTTNSTYKANLDKLLDQISSDTKIDYGFYNFSYGQETDRVYGIALCRGDLSISECRSCLNGSIHDLPQQCPTQKEALGRYDGACMLRYSSRNIFGKEEEYPTIIRYNTGNISNVTQFDNALGPLLRNLQTKVASGSSTLKFSVNQTSLTPFQNIYGLMQCTPDLGWTDCYHCLDSAIAEIQNSFPGKQGGVVFYPSCNLRFDLYRFAELPGSSSSPSSPPPPTPSSPESTSTSNGKGTIKVLKYISITAASSLLIVIALIIFWVWRKKKMVRQVATRDEDRFSSRESLNFDFGTIMTATDNFSDSNRLGRGGFGTVYKGTLTNGQHVAVKRLEKNSLQGEMEFKNEVMLVAKLQHRNLVRIVGCSIEGEERLLVYEFMPNASLDKFLFDANRRGQVLDWPTRYKIIKGIVRGMIYLHEDSRVRVIHRDLKPSNILLDEQMSPKISDFGMARLFQVDQTHADTERIAGTYGYMAPEYALHGFLSIKSDVYSFGVLLLEIICGQRNAVFRGGGEDAEDLVTSVWRHWSRGEVLGVIDPILNAAAASRHQMLRCIHIGLLCVQEDAADRPTMSSILLMLNSQSLSLPPPSQPPFVMTIRDTTTHSSSSKESGSVFSSQNRKAKDQSMVIDESITEFHPR